MLGDDQRYSWRQFFLVCKVLSISYMLGPPSSVLHVTVQMSKESYPNWLHWVRGYECVKDPRKLFVLLIKRTGCNGYNHSSFAFFFFFFFSCGSEWDGRSSGPLFATMRKTQRHLRIMDCVSLGPSRSRCLYGIKCIRLFLWENACVRENREGTEEGWESHQIMIKSDPKWRREGEKVLRSKESSIKPPGSLQTKAGGQRSPGSPRSASASVSLLHRHWLGAARGRHSFGTNTLMDFKEKQLEPLVRYAPCSWRTMRHSPSTNLCTIRP